MVSVKKESVEIIDAITVYFNTLLLIIYESAVERLVCCREMSLIGSTSFRFAQNMIHDFQNTLLNSMTNAIKTMLEKEKWWFALFSKVLFHSVYGS